MEGAKEDLVDMFIVHTMAEIQVDIAVGSSVVSNAELHLYIVRSATTLFYKFKCLFCCSHFKQFFCSFVKSAIIAI